LELTQRPLAQVPEVCFDLHQPLSDLPLVTAVKITIGSLWEFSWARSIEVRYHRFAGKSDSPLSPCHARRQGPAVAHERSIKSQSAARATAVLMSCPEGRRVMRSSASREWRSEPRARRTCVPTGTGTSTGRRRTVSAECRANSPCWTTGTTLCVRGLDGHPRCGWFKPSPLSRRVHSSSVAFLICIEAQHSKIHACIDTRRKEMHK
jgi:hypothetical protein